MTPDQPVTITLAAQQWNVVLAALAEAPWRVADPVIREIARQTGAPTEPAAPTDAIPARTNGEDHAAA